MKITPAPYCKRCRFYHGADRVVCSVHPYGPGIEACSDYQPKANGLEKDYASRYGCRSSRHYSWKDWRNLLILGLLLGAFGLGWELRWSVIRRPEPVTEPITRRL